MYFRSCRDYTTPPCPSTTRRLSQRSSTRRRRYTAPAQRHLCMHSPTCKRLAAPHHRCTDTPPCTTHTRTPQRLRSCYKCPQCRSMRTLCCSPRDTHTRRRNLWAGLRLPRSNVLPCRACTFPSVLRTTRSRLCSRTQLCTCTPAPPHIGRGSARTVCNNQRQSQRQSTWAHPSRRSATNTREWGT